MPTINKTRKPTRQYVKTARAEAAAEFYNTTTWRRLRDAYYLTHPLCELCLEKGITSPTEEIHHIFPISQGKNRLEMRQRAFNPNNLMAVCKECHHKIHNQLKYGRKIEQRG